jgi:hypothetical protein
MLSRSATMTDTQPERPLTEAEVVARYAGLFKPAALRLWRRSGKGPHYLKVGRAVFYRVEDIEAFLRDCVR